MPAIEMSFADTCQVCKWSLHWTPTRPADRQQADCTFDPLSSPRLREAK
jgi:hypothetical protein